MNKKKGIIIGAAVAAVLTAVVLVLIFVPKGGSSDPQEATYDEGVDLSVSVDKDGVHQAVVNLDKDGKIANNSYGTLMEYYPAQITSIHVENVKGSFDVESNTPEGEATVYTIKGYEDFDLQGGNPDMIASAAASLSFTKVATLDNDRAGEFGFDKPRSVVTVTYSDKTKAIITVGDDAPQSASTYIKFGTGDAIYITDSKTVSAFDYGVTDLISLTINDAAEVSENGQASSIKLSGAGFPREITLEPNTDTNYSATYIMTAPESRFANEHESSLIAGGLRGLMASSVTMVNPSADQLKKLGLDKPNAQVKAVFPDTEVELIASKPDGKGDVNLMVAGGKVVYKIASDKVAWTKTGFEKLCYEYALYPKMTELSGVTVKSGGKTYDLTVDTHNSVTTDDKGKETETMVTTVKMDGKEIKTGRFTTFFDAASLISMADVKSESGGSEVFSVKYTFTDGGSGTVEFLDKGGESYIVKVNGKAQGHCAKADITHAQKALDEMIK